MVVISFFGLVGGVLTLLLTWSHDPIIALLQAQLGASAAGLSAALAIGMVRTQAAHRPILWRGRTRFHPYSAQALTLRR